MTNRQAKMYDVKSLREEYKKSCTKIGMINNLGFLGKYLFQIEIFVFVVISLVFLFVLL